MHKIAQERGIETGHLYLIATKLLVNLDPHADYDPDADRLLEFYLEICQ